MAQIGEQEPVELAVALDLLDVALQGPDRDVEPNAVGQDIGAIAGIDHLGVLGEQPVERQRRRDVEPGPDLGVSHARHPQRMAGHEPKRPREPPLGPEVLATLEHLLGLFHQLLEAARVARRVAIDDLAVAQDDPEVLEGQDRPAGVGRLRRGARGRRLRAELLTQLREGRVELDRQIGLARHLDLLGGVGVAVGDPLEDAPIAGVDLR